MIAQPSSAGNSAIRRRLVLDGSPKARAEVSLSRNRVPGHTAKALWFLSGVTEECVTAP
ncbi:MAG: hypothetical protein M3Z75_20375 [Actinomycetota bacterium]|nr:hypothetical protein [Actinomycetota bacterium]